MNLIGDMLSRDEFAFGFTRAGMAVSPDIADLRAIIKPNPEGPGVRAELGEAEILVSQADAESLGFEGLAHALLGWINDTSSFQRVTTGQDDIRLDLRSQDPRSVLNLNQGQGRSAGERAIVNGVDVGTRSQLMTLGGSVGATFQTPGKLLQTQANSPAAPSPTNGPNLGSLLSNPLVLIGGLLLLGGT